MSRGSGAWSRTTISSRPSSSRAPGFRTAPDPYCVPFANVTTNGAISSRSPAHSSVSGRRAVGDELAQAQVHVAEEPAPAAALAALVEGVADDRVEAGAGDVQERAAVETADVHRGARPRTRAPRALERGRAAGAARARGRCPSPTGTMPRAAPVPITPRATSFTVPSPPTASDHVRAARHRLAREIGRVPGRPREVHGEVVPARPPSLDGVARAVGGDAGARVQDRADLHATSATTASVASTIRSAVNRSRKRRRPASPYARRRASSPRTAASACGERLRVARRGEAAVDAVLDGLGDPAGRGRDDREAEGHRVEKARAEALEVRREAEDRERRHQAVEVAAEARRRRRGPRGRARAPARRGRLAAGPRRRRRAAPRACAAAVAPSPRRASRGPCGPSSAATLPTTGAPAGTPSAGERLPAPRRRRAVDDALVDEPQPRRGDAARLDDAADRAAHDDDAVAGRVLAPRERRGAGGSRRGAPRRAAVGPRGGWREGPPTPRAGRAATRTPGASRRRSRARARMAGGQRSPRKPIGWTTTPAARGPRLERSPAPAGDRRAAAARRRCRRR